MNHHQAPRNDLLPYLQQGLSRLSPSDWVHQLRIALAQVTDFTPGPIVTWTEELPWAWVTWGIDTSYGFEIPRPDEVVEGHIYVHEILMPDPSAGAIARQQVVSSVRPAVMRRKDRSVLEVIDTPVQLAGAVSGAVGFVGGGALTRAVDATSLIPTVWGAIAGGLVGVGGWAFWRQRGRLHTRTWRAAEHDADVPYDLATMDVLHAQLRQTAGWVNDPDYTAELHNQLDTYRWGLLDPAQVPDVRGNLDRLNETIQELVASAHEAGERAVGRRVEILNELAASYPVDTQTGDDGAADKLQARIAALRDLHGLD